MNSWREKVADKLSRLLASSPSSSSPQALLLSSEEAHSPKSSQISSYLVSFLQLNRSSVHKDSSDRHTGWGGPRLQLPSSYGRWASKNLSLNDDSALPLDLDDKSTHTSANTGTRNGNDEVEINNDNLVLFVQSGNEIPVRIEETSTSQSLEHFYSSLMDESTFICFNLFEFFQSSLPNIVKGRRWVLLYSTLKHGISLRTLIRKSADLPGPCLLIVGDNQGAIFGGLLDGPLKPTAKRKYQGTNQTFLFTTIYGAPRLFRSTGANRYYYLCLNDLLAFGGGGNFALCLDGDLLHGTSGPSETFGNLCLAHSPEFELKNVELWGFTHISQYLK